MKSLSIEERRECLAAQCLKHNIHVRTFRKILDCDLDKWLSANDGTEIIKAVNSFANDVAKFIKEHVEDELPKYYWRGKFDNRKHCDTNYITEQLNLIPLKYRQALVIGYSELYQKTYNNTDNDIKKANKARYTANSWLRKQVHKIAEE